MKTRCEHYFETEEKFGQRCRAMATETIRISLRHGAHIEDRDVCAPCAKSELQLNLWGAPYGHVAIEVKTP